MMLWCIWAVLLVAEDLGCHEVVFQYLSGIFKDEAYGGARRILSIAKLQGVKDPGKRAKAYGVKSTPYKSSDIEALHPNFNPTKPKEYTVYY